MRILVADGHKKVRWALSTLVRETPGLTLVGEATETEGLLLLVKEQQPDLVLLDWALSGQPKKDVLDALRALDVPPKVIVLSSHPEDQREALADGAHSFVSKIDAPERLLSTFRELIEEAENQESESAGKLPLNKE